MRIMIVVNPDLTVERQVDTSSPVSRQDRMAADLATVRSVVTQLRSVGVGDTFVYRGRTYRKLPGGVRLAKGRPPKVLEQLDPETPVIRAS